MKVLEKSSTKNWQATLNSEMDLKRLTTPLQIKIQLNKIGTDPVTKRKTIGFYGRGSFLSGDFDVKTTVGSVGNTV